MRSWRGDRAWRRAHVKVVEGQGLCLSLLASWGGRAGELEGSRSRTLPPYGAMVTKGGGGGAMGGPTTFEFFRARQPTKAAVTSTALAMARIFQSRDRFFMAMPPHELRAEY